MMTVQTAGAQPLLAVSGPFPVDLMEAFVLSTAVNGPGRDAPSYREMAMPRFPPRVMAGAPGFPRGPALARS